MAYANKEVAMNILITCQTPHESGLIDERFGRCDYYCIYDTDRETYTFQKNASKSANQGAGISFSQRVIELDINVILTGKIGPKAMDVLQSSDIHAYEVTNMKVLEALEAYQKKTLNDIK